MPDISVYHYDYLASVGGLIHIGFRTLATNTNNIFLDGNGEDATNTGKEELYKEGTLNATPLVVSGCGGIELVSFFNNWLKKDDVLLNAFQFNELLQWQAYCGWCRFRTA